MNKNPSISANLDRNSENSVSLPYLGTVFSHSIEIPPHVKNLDPNHIPIKKIVFNNNTFEDKNYNMMIKIIPEQFLLNIIITNSEVTYTVAIRKENLLHEYLISDVIKKLIIIRGQNIQLIVEQQNATKIVNLPEFEEELEEKITIFPTSLVDALTQLKGTPWVEQREKRERKKNTYKEEDEMPLPVPVVKKAKSRTFKRKELPEIEETDEKKE